MSMPLLLPPASLKGVCLDILAQGTLPEMQAEPGRPSIRHAVQCLLMTYHLCHMQWMSNKQLQQA